MTGTPPVRRRLLGTALREYRESLGYNLDEAARILECDRSKPLGFSTYNTTGALRNLKVRAIKPGADG